MIIKPGAYRVPLVAGLVAIGEDELSKQVADHRIKLALRDSIRGAVVTRKDLSHVFVEAFETEFATNSADEGVVDYYKENLNNGSVVPVENKRPMSFNRHYAPGELFFKT